MGLNVSPDVQAHVDRIRPEIEVQRMREDFNGRIRDLVFDVVFADAQIKIDFDGADIRRTTMCGEVVKGVLKCYMVNDISIGRNIDELIRLIQAFQTGDLCPVGWKKGDKTLGK